MKHLNRYHFVNKVSYICKLNCLEMSNLLKIPFLYVHTLYKTCLIFNTKSCVSVSPHTVWCLWQNDSTLSVTSLTGEEKQRFRDYKNGHLPNANVWGPMQMQLVGKFQQPCLWYIQRFFFINEQMKTVNETFTKPLLFRLSRSNCSRFAGGVTLWTVLQARIVEACIAAVNRPTFWWGSPLT